MIAVLLGLIGKASDIQTQIGTAGAGLTAIPWNAAWDAEVQSECTDALNAYDPPTKAEMDTGLAGIAPGTFIATGAVSATRAGTSTGEDTSYYDVTISGVTDYTNCIVYLQNPYFYASSDTYPLANAYRVTGRLTSNTNLRIASRRDDASRLFVTRYYIWEMEA